MSCRRGRRTIAVGSVADHGVIGCRIVPIARQSGRKRSSWPELKSISFSHADPKPNSRRRVDGKRERACNETFQLSIASYTIRPDCGMSRSYAESHFTSSPLSAPPSSPRKPSKQMAPSSPALVLADTTVMAGEAEGEASNGDVYEVEAIMARRGGEKGKKLMYLIRWVSIALKDPDNCVLTCQG